ncbi:MAG: tyrosine-type recombinase/integrase [Bacteroidetes bacterium]|jgi:integrase/recombinase XerC|nr:tyrosine-type recombinase/integrase [Bacteroidota bacterium]
MSELTGFLDYIKYEKSYSAHTFRSYENDLRQFIAFQRDITQTKNLKWHDITAFDIRAFIIYLTDSGLETSSVNRKLSTLKTFFKYLCREGFITTSPMSKVLTPKLKKQLPSFIEQSRMDFLFDHIEFPNDFNGRRSKAVVEILYGTGIRLSELIHLKITDIDQQKKTIKVLGKRNKERIIPMHPSLQITLNKYLENRKKIDNPEPWFIVTQKGKQAYPKLIYRIVHEYIGYVSTIEKKSPHVLRHTFATHLLNSGAELNAIKELLGHANLSATQIYTHTSFRKLKNIYKQAHPRA